MTISPTPPPLGLLSWSLQFLFASNLFFASLPSLLSFLLSLFLSHTTYASVPAGCQCNLFCSRYTFFHPFPTVNRPTQLQAALPASLPLNKVKKRGLIGRRFLNSVKSGSTYPRHLHFFQSVKQHNHSAQGSRLLRIELKKVLNTKMLWHLCVVAH